MDKARPRFPKAAFDKPSTSLRQAQADIVEIGEIFKLYYTRHQYALNYHCLLLCLCHSELVEEHSEPVEERQRGVGRLRSPKPAFDRLRLTQIKKGGLTRSV
jgi:hypothetical protein